MSKLPDDMIFYFQTPAGYQYRSVWVNLKSEKINVVKIDEDDFYGLLNSEPYHLKKQFFSPIDFPYELPADIIGEVIAYII